MQIREKNIYSRDALLEAIEKLEGEQKEHVLAIKKDMHDAYDSLKPANVIKTLVSELFTSQEVRKDLFQSGIGLGAGILARKMLVGKSNSLLKRIAGHLVQVGVTNIVNSNEEEIESKGRNLIQRLIHRYGPNGKKEEESSELSAEQKGPEEKHETEEDKFRKEKDR